MSSGPNDGHDDIVYADAEVLAGDGASAEAVLIRRGRIAAVGAESDVLAAAGPGVERQGLDGATVIPGLIDTHPHLLHFAAMRAPLVDITGARNHADITEAIHRKAATLPAGEWIMTTPVGEPHYFHRRSWRDLTEGVLPNRRVLDRATSDHPVMIQAWSPVLPNACAVNSAALAALGIDASTPDRVHNVSIDKDDDGAPTGILRGSVTTYYNQDPFFEQLRAQMPSLIQPELVPAATLEAMAGYNGQGITTIYEGHAMDFPHIELYRGLREQDLLTLRVQAVPELEPTALPGDHPLSPNELTNRLSAALAMRSLDDDWLRIDGITACTYGPCYSGHLLWRAGYTSPWGGATTTGVRNISEENTRLAFGFCAEHGLRLNLCAVSPDEHDDHLAMTSEVMEAHGLDRTGWVLQHGYLIREDQARRFAELGFDMTVSMSFTFGKGDMIAERIGPDAIQQLNPLRHLLDAGLTVAGSMDWGPTNPFEQMRLAVTHDMFPSGKSNAGPAQTITRAEALHMWTAAGAKLLDWDGIGTLTPGSHADLAILDRNPITCDLDALPTTRVLRTHVDGRIVHDNGTLTPGNTPAKGGHPAPTR